MPRFETRLTRDVVYGTGAVRAPRPAPKPLLLDLYEPVGRDVPVRRPGVVLLHGGGWTRGDKRGPEPYSNMTELCRELEVRAKNGQLVGAGELVDRIEGEYTRLEEALAAQRTGAPS